MQQGFAGHEPLVLPASPLVPFPNHILGIQAGEGWTLSRLRSFSQHHARQLTARGRGTLEAIFQWGSVQNTRPRFQAYTWNPCRLSRIGRAHV